MNHKKWYTGTLLPKFSRLLSVSALLLGTCLAWGQPAAVPSPGLAVGQTVPDVLLPALERHPRPTARLSEFRGKLLILDFWATWCAPCVAAVPKLDSLQQQYAGRVQILPVTYQSGKEVTTFLERLQRQKKMQFTLPQVVSDTVLHRLFPHQALPHYVWIDAQGTVRAITEGKDVTAAHIEALLRGEPLAVRQKAEVLRRPYDPSRPALLTALDTTGGNLLYGSVLTGLREELPFRWDQSVATAQAVPVRKITALNLPLPMLYQAAFSEGRRSFRWNRTDLEVQDRAALYTTLTGQDYLDWLRAGRGFCYELVVPPALADSAWRLMQQDLHRLFPQYQAYVEKRPRPCLVLERNTSRDKLKSRGGPRVVSLDRTGGTLRAVPLAVLVRELNSKGVGALVAPVVNRTDYPGLVDLTLEADLTRVESVNAALRPYGLQLRAATQDLDILVIRDRPVPTAPLPGR